MKLCAKISCLARFFSITFVLCGVDWACPGMSVASFGHPACLWLILAVPMRECSGRHLQEFPFFYSELPNWKGRAMSKWGAVMGNLGKQLNFPLVWTRKGAVEPRRSNWYCAARFYLRKGEYFHYCLRAQHVEW